MKRQHRTDSNRETKWKLNDRSDHCDSHSTRSCVFGLVVTSLRRRVKLKPVQLLKRVSRPQQRPVYKGKNASGVNGVSHSVRVGFSFSPSEDHNKHTANISVICSRVGIESSLYVPDSAIRARASVSCAVNRAKWK